MESKFYQIDEVAKLTEISKRTIRYYEDMGLFVPARSDACYRLYTEEDIELIREIKNLRIKVGMNLDQVKKFLGLRKNIHSILDGDSKDPEQIRDVQYKIKELLVIVEEREEVLKNIKNNCMDYLSKLEEKAGLTE
jgi:DNA-binding transcriptional MerR regulator